MKRSLYALLLLIAGMSVGCAPKISAAKVDTLKLGETTDAQVKEMFGEPEMVDAYNDSKGGSVVCWYMNTGGGMIGPYRAVMAEAIAIEYRDLKLNGYIFISNDGENATKINSEAGKAIQIGKTKQPEVTQLLGKPAGRIQMPSRFPDLNELNRPGTTEVWAYTAADELNGWAWSQAKVQMLMVAFSGDGTVTEMALRTFTRRIP